MKICKRIRNYSNLDGIIFFKRTKRVFIIFVLNKFHFLCPLTKNVWIELQVRQFWKSLTADS